MQFREPPTPGFNACRIGRKKEQVQMSTSTKKLVGKVALVTGASKGIGAQIAKQLAEDGAKVVVNYASSREGADRVVKEIVSRGGAAVAVQADVSDQAQIKRLLADTVKAYDRLDILVNNAGIYEIGPLEQITAESFHRQFNLNVLGLLLTTQEAVKYFGSAGGSVINISSVVSTLAPPNSAVYNATKGAVDAVTKTLAKELGPRKIRVNAVNPGMVDTEGVRASAFVEMKSTIASMTPLGRTGQPEDIAPAVSFLASADSSWVTGEVLTISGGWR